jgi:hypothetical protein
VLGDIGVELHAAFGEHEIHELQDVLVGENRKGELCDVVDAVDEAQGVEGAGQIDRTPDEPADRIVGRFRVLALGA